MGVLLHSSALRHESPIQCIPKSWQTSEEGYEGHQRHGHGEDDDVARECHGERPSTVLLPMNRIVVGKECARFPSLDPSTL